MRLLISFLLLVIVGGKTHAQSSKNYPVNAGESPERALPQEAKFFFPAFTEGTVFMRDGSSSKQRLNYSKLLDEMQFLTATGDTLTIANPDLIKTVAIDSFSFYYQKGYLRKIAEEKEYILAVKELMIQVPEGKEIGYGASIATGSITSFSRITSDNGKQYSLTVKRNVFFTELKAFYIGDQYNHFNRADKKGFADMFTKKREAIVEYMKSEKLNLNRVDDIKQLFRFCIKEPG